MGAKNNIKGITIELNGNTSKLEDSLKNVNRDIYAVNQSLKQVQSELKMNPNNVQSVNKAFNTLQTAIQLSKDKLSTLKMAQEQLDAKGVDEASDQYVNLSKEITKTQNNIASLQNQQDKLSSLPMNELADATDRAGQNALKFGDIVKANVIADVIVKGLENVVDVTKRIGNSLVQLGKQSLDLYADYEQLTGGVEAMFGGYENGATQIDKVKDTAKKAWKDLTMSQNEYFETFNSTFPLISNGIEDENAAIDTTNRLLQLESDLANTFGYDMTTASNAINWALKGNYSYIDNLNIGIKGTKEGFLEAAQGAGYMVSSVDELSGDQILDVLEKTADKFGVLGRTSKEASMTIQGSVKSMKASWQNMLIGIADDNANFEQLTNDLIDSLLGSVDESGERVGGVINQIIPRIETILNGLGDLLVAFASQILPKLVTSVLGVIQNLCNTLLANMPRIISSISQIITTILTTLQEMAPMLGELVVSFISGLITIIFENLPQLIETIISLIVSVAQALTEQLPTLIPIVVKGLLDAIQALLDNIDKLIDCAIELTLAILDGIIATLPILIEEMPVIVEKLVTKLTDPEQMEKVLNAAFLLVVKLAEGIIKNIPQLIQAQIKIMSSLIKGFQNYTNNMKELGKQILDWIKNGILAGITAIGRVGGQLMEGLVNGIKEKWNHLKDSVTNLGKGIIDKFKNVFGIHSPSKVFKGLGGQLGAGLEIGIKDSIPNVNRAMNELGKGINTSMNPVINPKVNNIKLQENSQNNNSNSNNNFNYQEMVKAFTEALSNVSLEMDHKKFGELISKTVYKEIQS